RIDGLQAEGRLRGESLSLAAAGSYTQVDAEHTARIERFTMQLGSTAVAVNGRVGEQVDVRWDVSSTDLSELLPEAAGRLRSSGNVAGRYPQLRVDAELDGRDLAYGDQRIGELLLVADVDLSGVSESTFELVAREGLLAEMEVQQVVANADGTPVDHRLQISLAADDVDVAAGLTGSLAEPWDETQRWNFVIDEALLRYAALAPWRLDGSASGVLGPDAVRIERHCWTAADADLCLAAAAGPQGAMVRADLSELALEYFLPLAPEATQLAGAVTARAHFDLAPDGLLVGEFRMNTSPGQVVLPPLADAHVVDAGLPPRLRFEPSQVSAVLETDQARVSAAVNLDYGRIRFEAMTPAGVMIGADGPGPPLGEQEVTGMLEVDVPDLAFLPELLPALARTEGTLAGRLQLDGTLQQPISSGSVVLRDGAATMPMAGVRITVFAATLEGRGPEGIHVEAVAASGPGRLTVDGILRLFGDVPSAALAIQGAEFEIMNTEDARILASPDLTMEADQQRILVSGVVAVPRAELTPVIPEPGAALPSADQVLVDEVEEEPAPPRELYAEIRLVPGDEVYFVGFGLDARIEGDVVVRESPATAVPTATGELRVVDGEYRAYGQVLAIERGRLFFAGGPVTEPAVDIEAVRRPREGILVGARVRGTLDAPDFSLFSEPPMSEQDQLAYLVLGRSLDEAPGGEGSVLSQAALALGLRGGDALAQQLGDWIGLDQLAIVTRPDEPGAEDDPGQAALVMGTYLSPRLYVSYGIGLFEPGSVLQLQYEISRRWRLVTRSGGEGSGVDLLFTLERGGD
ncbi:MAG: translocation/assembly module TamB domain-containing protein, partial [Pseudomonadales bacterium]